MAPPRWNELTIEQQLGFTMLGTIPIYDWYIDETPSATSTTTAPTTPAWTDNFIESFMKRFTKFNIKNNLHGTESYNNASLWHLTAFEKYNIVGKKIAVIGSQTPWIEVIAMACGNNDITTVEYNVPRTNKYIKTVSYTDFANSPEEYDVIVSYSSIEHSGLTRYGDPINYNGDIEAVNVIHKKLAQDGLLFLGIPVGLDSIAWTAHRVYGHKRLSIILKEFEEVEWIGIDKSFLDNCGSDNNGPQPIIVLKKK